LDPDANVFAVNFAAESHGAPAGGIFECVGNQIEDDLLQAPSIGDKKPAVFLAIELER
jgi:hypothetical protein